MALSHIDSVGDLRAGTSPGVTFGTAPNAGDVIVAFAGCPHNKSVDTPAGYTLLGTVSVSYPNSERLYCFVKVAAGSEVALAPTFNGAPGYSCVMTNIYRGTGLAWSALMSSSNSYDTYGTYEAAGPAWAALPVDQVVAVAGQFTNISAYYSTADAVNGASWTDRYSVRVDDPTYNVLFAAMATNTAETMSPVLWYLASSSTSGVAVSLMVYVYETSGKRSKLILGM